MRGIASTICHVKDSGAAAIAEIYSWYIENSMISLEKVRETLIHELRAMPIHVLIAGIDLPNEAGVKLHEKLGLKKIGQLEEVEIK